MEDRKETKTTEQPKEQAQEQKVQKETNNIITGSTGGTYFALGGAMATPEQYIDNVQ